MLDVSFRLKVRSENPFFSFVKNTILQTVCMDWIKGFLVFSAGKRRAFTRSSSHIDTLNTIFHYAKVMQNDAYFIVVGGVNENAEIS